MNYERLILDLAAEDFVGLWELIWRLNVVAPDEDVQTARKRLRAALGNLLNRNAVDLYSGITFSGEESAVSANDRTRLLDSGMTWEAPEPNARHVRVAATEAGQAEYVGKREQE